MQPEIFGGPAQPVVDPSVHAVQRIAGPLIPGPRLPHRVNPLCPFPACPPEASGVLGILDLYLALLLLPLLVLVLLLHPSSIPLP